MKSKPGRGRCTIFLLYLEVVSYIILARFVLMFFSFHRISGLISRQPRRRELSMRQRRLSQMMIKKCIFKVFKRLPFSTTCFHRAIAAHLMLRRRGIATTLHYGAAIHPEKGLMGHVWLKDGSRFIVGRDASKTVHALARYPEY